MAKAFELSSSKTLQNGQKQNRRAPIVHQCSSILYYFVLENTYNCANSITFSIAAFKPSRSLPPAEA